MDLIIDVDLNKSWATDNLSDTINYGHLYKIVEDEMKIKSKLIESILYRIIQRIKSDYSQINKVKVRVHKPNPPINGKIENIYVELEW